jgi:2-haloalkanoic acid dehalogenase type II
MIHTIFFDVGGTLVTSKSTLTLFAELLDPKREREIFDFLLKKFMLYYENDKAKKFYSVKEILAIALKAAAEELNLPDLSDETEKYYRINHLKNARLFDDTMSVLEKLKDNNIKMIISSDADDDILLEQLEMFGILDYFDGLIISGNVKAYKPSDIVVEEALKYCRKPFSGILFVGDNIVDMKMAQKMKIKSALINRRGKFKYDADYRISSLKELIDIFQSSKKTKNNDNTD